MLFLTKKNNKKILLTIHIQKGYDQMKIEEKMKKPMMETKYLNVENTDRYRPIIRLFYLKYEKLKYWMYQEEIFEGKRKILLRYS